MIIWRDVEKLFVQIQHLFFTSKKKNTNKQNLGNWGVKGNVFNLTMDIYFKIVVNIICNEEILKYFAPRVQDCLI